jgi:hypothetical protein
MTHDYKRNGTATLFAALNAANGEVFGLNYSRMPMAMCSPGAAVSGIRGKL